MRLTVLGDALLDRDLHGHAGRLAPDAPVPVVDDLREHARPGGAGLAAVLAGRAGAEVTLVTALADDEAGGVLAILLADAGIDVVDVGLDGATPQKVRVMAAGHPLLRLDHGGEPGAPGPLTGPARAALAGADAVLVSDYGRGMAAQVAGPLAPDAPPLVWDPHPRGPEPVRGAVLVTPNADEASRFAGVGDSEDQARLLRGRWGVGAVCVTRGRDGALLVDPDGAHIVPAPAVAGDPCGAGDCFAATVAAEIGRGEPSLAAVRMAVAAASAFVAAGGARAVRKGAGTLVATGGCFDLLHAGHVRMLEAARAHGDRLVVLLNSDASVRRLKGPGRPLVAQQDRVDVLRALRCVDDVVVFDEDEPSRALQRLRPDVWVKGGDYAVEDLPEAGVLAGWGARIVLVPYVAGRSTTRLIEEAMTRGAA
jgi:rfaE bifunctional protein nucleotidyltransferase chain/domain/rfaE bifunctional protein kinase chain/domain